MMRIFGKIWMVVYDDFDCPECIAVFNRPERAEAFAAWKNGPEAIPSHQQYTVEEVPIDPLPGTMGSFVIESTVMNTDGSYHRNDLKWDPDEDPEKAPERLSGSIANGWRAFGKTSDEAREALRRAKATQAVEP